jgi:hypothetical protein
MKVKVKNGKIVKKKKSVESRYKPDNAKILVRSLHTLVEEMLPLAVRAYKTKQSRGNVYTITNIISEVRGVIQQLSTLIDSRKVKNEINEILMQVLRKFLSIMIQRLHEIKETHAVKITDSAHRRQLELVIEDIQRNFEKEIQITLTEIDLRISNVIHAILAPDKKAKSKKRS